MRILAGLLALITLAFSTFAIAQSEPADDTPATTPIKAVMIVPPAVEPENVWVLELSTGGQVKIQLRPDAAPNHVERIKTLTRQGFYNGLVFHRVIEGFMAQGGDPSGTGEHGSALPDLKAEFNTLPHVRGAVSAARTENEDSANSQFFIMLMPVLRLDTKYTVFGRVISGMQYVDAIHRGEPPADPSRVIRAWIEADGPNAPLRPAAVAAPAPQATPTPDATPAPEAVPTPAPEPAEPK